MTQWWSNRSDPERFDLYTRWSLYLLFAVVPLGTLSLGSNSGAGQGTFLAISVLCVVQAGVAIALLSKGITHCLGGPRPPAILVVGMAGLSVAGAAVSLTIPAVSLTSDGGSGVWLPYLFVLVGIAAGSPMFSNQQLVLGSIGLAIAVGGLASWQGAEATQAVSTAAGIGISLISVTLAFRISVRMLKIVWQIEHSRTVESALAVAEERLRFSRDLHDVLGRHLSLIAVKSELASEFLRRGRPEAATEIGEVNRITQEALREVRAVVRGYRQADLATELAGARAVLAAAGIQCQVEGDPGSVPSDLQETLGWVVREATTNVLRHSRARTCTIGIEVTASAALLTMVNDGVAVEEQGVGDRSAATGDRRGSGLAGLEDRLRARGGTLQAGSQGSASFCVRVSLPRQHDASAANRSPAGSPGVPMPRPAEHR